jgi:carbon monoxide dehydrogenase subunit G
MIFKELDPTHYEAMFETKIAYLRFAVTVEVIRIEAPGEIEAKIESIPLGIIGRLVAKSTTNLTDVGGAMTVSYSVDSTLAGNLGSIGQPLLRAKAKEMERQFATRVRAVFGPATDELVL